LVHFAPLLTAGVFAPVSAQRGRNKGRLRA
jgi:hypothetical protein